MLTDTLYNVILMFMLTDTLYNIILMFMLTDTLYNVKLTFMLPISIRRVSNACQTACHCSVLLLSGAGQWRIWRSFWNALMSMIQHHSQMTASLHTFTRQRTSGVPVPIPVPIPVSFPRSVNLSIESI